MNFKQKITISILFLFFLFPKITFGQEGFEEQKKSPSITITPSIIEIDVSLGQTLEKGITVENEADFAMPIRVDLNDYSQDEEGLPDYSENLSGRSPVSWIEIDPVNLIVEVESTRDVNLKIAVPEEAQLGSHLATVLFKPVLPPEHFEPHSSHVIPYIGAIVALNVKIEDPDRQKDYLQIQKFSSQKPAGSEPREFFSQIKNQDVYYHKIEGEIEISNIFHNVVETIKVDGATILPSKTKKFASKLEETPFYGKYTAKLKVGDQEQRAEQTTSFWVLPSIQSVIIFSFVSMLSFFLILKRKNTKKAIQILLSKKHHHKDKKKVS